ncbi:hypothetical protein L1887_27620 [Cichorium endivia]|nr:hypothetical protein L1887_27620 [Cichorium endivia]
MLRLLDRHYTDCRFDYLQHIHDIHAYGETRKPEKKPFAIEDIVQDKPTSLETVKRAWVISPTWLKESFREGRFVDETDYIVKVLRMMNIRCVVLSKGGLQSKNDVAGVVNTTISLLFVQLRRHDVIFF